MFRLTAAGSRGDAVRRRWCPVPRQQFCEPVNRVGADACDNVCEPGFRLDAVEARRPDERIECGGAFATAVGATE